MTEWKCGECSSLEKDKKILVKKTSSQLFIFWSRIGKIFPFTLPELPEEVKWKSQTKEDEVKVVAMCHHCGKPLCQQHRFLIVDDAFSIDEEEMKSLLPSWWPQSIELKANKRFRLLENRFLSWLAKYHSGYNQFKQKAYHCKACWQKYHLLAEQDNDW
ncbi:MAG: hypothetical protein QNJ33_04610 [Crocosphaera sp.]|nr:hypothetical protein [Crocosphaera sp.]